MTLLYQRGRRGGGDSTVKFRPVIPDLPENLPRAPGLPCLEAEPFRLGERLLCRGRPAQAHPQHTERVEERRGSVPGAGKDRFHARRGLLPAFPGKDRRPCEVVGCLGIAGPDLQRLPVFLLRLPVLLLRQPGVAQVHPGLEKLPVLPEGPLVFPDRHLEFPATLVRHAEFEMPPRGRGVGWEDDAGHPCAPCRREDRREEEKKKPPPPNRGTATERNPPASQGPSRQEVPLRTTIASRPIFAHCASSVGKGITFTSSLPEWATTPSEVTPKASR